MQQLKFSEFVLFTLTALFPKPITIFKVMVCNSQQ